MKIELTKEELDAISFALLERIKIVQELENTLPKSYKTELQKYIEFTIQLHRRICDAMK